jgi:hypothetical protein
MIKDLLNSKKFEIHDYMVKGFKKEIKKYKQFKIINCQKAKPYNYVTVINNGNSNDFNEMLKIGNKYI